VSHLLKLSRDLNPPRKLLANFSGGGKFRRYSKSQPSLFRAEKNKGCPNRKYRGRRFRDDERGPASRASSARAQENSAQNASQEKNTRREKQIAGGRFSSQTDSAFGR
jgi:hypothetical protein